MGRAYTNAIVLDGTKKMQHVKGKIVLVEDSLITGIVPQAERPGNYDACGMGGKRVHMAQIVKNMEVDRLPDKRMKGKAMKGAVKMDSKNQQYRVANLVGVPTDYSKEDSWAHLPESKDKPVDTFFVYPTVYNDPTPGAPTIVPIENEQLRAAVANNYFQAPLLFEDLTNLYEPYYRQSNLFALFGKSPEDLMAFQLREQRTDLYAALDYYFEHFNQGRPFILAGHSQGSLMLKIALQDYFREHVDYLERMVAAYILGFSITTDDLANNPELKFAEGADDTGVIVSWNTEGPGNKNEKNGVVLPNSIAINPLNWRRDDTYAPASENLGDRLPVMPEVGVIATEFHEHHPGLADAQLDLERGVVISTTMAEHYVKPPVPGMRNIFGPASLHVSDYPAFWDNIRQNVKDRINAFLEKRG